MKLINFLKDIAGKLFDILNNRKKKYSDKKTAKKLYKKIYVPILNLLLPFFRNYDGNDNNGFAANIVECKDILTNNFSIANPAYTKYINRIINYKDEFKRYMSAQPKRKQNKYKKLDTIKREKKEKYYRKTNFDYLAHDIIVEYSQLRKDLGMGRLTHKQKINLDQVYFDRTNSIFAALMGAAIVLACIVAIFEIALFISSINRLFFF